MAGTLTLSKGKGQVHVFQKTVVGTIMPDGTLFAGISPTTKRPLYAMPSDLYGIYPLWEGGKRINFAECQRFGGHSDWRLPSIMELRLLWEFQDVIGKFNPGWYWSRSLAPSCKKRNVARRFPAGVEKNRYITNPARVRLVRS
jgi:hypothetical protein